MPKSLAMWWGPTKAICYFVRLYAVTIPLGSFHFSGNEVI